MFSFKNETRTSTGVPGFLGAMRVRVKIPCANSGTFLGGVENLLQNIHQAHRNFMKGKYLSKLDLQSGRWEQSCVVPVGKRATHQAFKLVALRHLEAHAGRQTPSLWILTCFLQKKTVRALEC